MSHWSEQGSGPWGGEQPKKLRSIEEKEREFLWLFSGREWGGRECSLVVPFTLQAERAILK